MDVSADKHFKEACHFHKEVRLDEALDLYTSLWNRSRHCQAAINAGAIYRQQGKNKEAISMLVDVTRVDPSNGAAWGNLGNNYMDVSANDLAIACYLRAIGEGVVGTDIVQSLVNALRLENLNHYALALAFLLLRSGHIESGFQVVEILVTLDKDNACSGRKDAELSLIIDKLRPILSSQIGPSGFKNIQKLLFMASSLIGFGSLEDAQRTIEIAKSTPVEQSRVDNKWEMINNLDWNLSNKLLHQAAFEEGWRKYDSGLKVKAAGKQKYQRSLFKPFSSTDVQLWRGESLEGKSLLVLGEQGIGDTMMFAVMLPTLASSRGAHITFVPGDRLVSIYKRSLGKEISILTCREAARASSTDFDYMIPVGSLMSYLWNEVSFPYLKQRLLVPNMELAISLASIYNLPKDRKTVGISWRGGGGKKKRVEAKSIDLAQMLGIFRSLDVNLISLQYGKGDQYIEASMERSGVSLLYDKDVDALKDMDLWLSQVSLCDFVVSIANTTCHGSGGLSIPTLCLVGKDYDWRWVDPKMKVRNSYWYSSVEAIFKQEESWTSELTKARDWIDACMVR